MARTTKPKRGAPKGSQNALKGAKPFDDVISFRCHSEDKQLAQRIALALGLTLEELLLQRTVGDEGAVARRALKAHLK